MREKTFISRHSRTSSKISILLVTKNRPALLKSCLRSIAEQSLKPDELVIVDSSNKPVIDIIRSFDKKLGFLYEYNPHYTIPQARNRCIDLASYNMLLFIDDDCTAEKHWVKKMIDFYQKFHNAHLISGKVIHVPTSSIYSLIIRTIRKNRMKLAKKKGKNIYINIENCILPKHWLLKNKIRFDERMLHEDFIDIVLQILNKHGNIISDTSTIVYHHERETLWKFLRQRFKNSGNTIRLSHKWKSKEFYFYGSQREKYIMSFVELLTYLYKKRQVLKILQMIIIVFLSVAIYDLGYLYHKYIVKT